MFEWLFRKNAPIKKTNLPSENCLPRAGSIPVQSEGLAQLEKEKKQKVMSEKAYQSVIERIKKEIIPTWKADEQYRYVRLLGTVEYPNTPNLKDWSPDLTDRLMAELKVAGWAARIDVIDLYMAEVDMYCMTMLSAAISKPCCSEIHGMTGPFAHLSHPSHRKYAIRDAEQESVRL